ncbi:hypothetical protein HU200_060329 [Digitaria exilis]|uniref:Glycosyltransferase 61 catalytic domain-containing protein n=1 Tax=Digitaria exilis TaxID=1010633 RepID=A0A835AAA2_9POAL|nr:hypothetical protein HU200_060329 [Digitaria exilis]
MKSWVQSHLNVGLVVGVLLVVLTYLVVSEQAASGRIRALRRRVSPRSNTLSLLAFPVKPTTTTKVLCSTDERLSDYCELEGDIRIRGRSWSVDIVPSTWSERHEWKIQPYSRRTATHVDKVNVTQLQGPPSAAPACTVTYTKPAIIFALGGYSGNIFHDHADVLLPLFYLSRRYAGEVQLLVINRVQPWWLGKYALALTRMSKYDVINLDGDTHVRCFRHVTVGLRLHKDFGIIPDQVPGGVHLAMPDFTRFLREAYTLPRDAAASLAKEPNKKPRMMMIQRQPYRRFVNEKEIVAAAEAAGFEVVVTELHLDAAVVEKARLVNSFDAILGLHGAGMTNEVFLPPGGVLIQVVPWGNIDLMARVEYGEPATEMGLKYFCYNITVQESSLLEEYGPDDPVITDPESVHRRGWMALYNIYLTKQNVRLDIARFSLTLKEAMDHFRQRHRKKMSCFKERTGNATRSCVPIVHLNVGFVGAAGILLVLLTYLVASQKDAITEKGKVVYNTKGHYSETCEVDGDVRVNGTAMSVSLVPTTATSSEHHQWSIRPYTGKAMSGIKNVTVTQLPDNVTAPPCTVTHTTPAVLFALGGLTGNFWHDFSDVLLPLFVASRRYAGEVQLLITNVQPWFPAAYGTILKGLSKHAAVDLDADDEHVVRCFRHVTVGIHQHKALSIVPEWVPGGHPLSMRDFTLFIREVYSLPRGTPVSLVREPTKKPRLLLIHRGHSRRFMNEPEIVKAAEAVGFEVVVMDLRRDVTVDAQARVVNTFDVVVGVHGAGLTNLVFLPPGAVVIQVVPYGRMEMMASLAFGEPARDMGLRYLEYNVTAEESTLLEMLGPEHPAIKDPESMHRSRWDKVMEFYLEKQNVRIDIARFAPTLAEAFDHLRQHPRRKGNITWNIWKERCRRVFDHKSLTVSKRALVRAPHPTFPRALGQSSRNLRAQIRHEEGISTIFGEVAHPATPSLRPDRYVLLSSLPTLPARISPATLMSCFEEKPGKSRKNLALIYLNIGFVVGVLFVLLTYLVVSQQTAISGLNENGKVVYNSKGYQSETCEVDGDVRINSTALSVTLVPTTSSSEHHQWSIRPYSRKTMANVNNITVTQLALQDVNNATAPACTVTYTIPAVLFSLGGLAGINFWHDFTDVLVPLFIASRRYEREVQFLITNMQPWWPVAYRTILQGLSKHDAVDLAGDDEHVVRCFPHVAVGLHQHRDLGIIPEWVPGGGHLSTPDFTRFLRKVYSLPRDTPVSLVSEPDKRPRLLLIHRNHTRRLMNEPEIVKAAEAAGFETVVMDMRREETVDAQARVVNTFDALLGVHGAGLTNLVFLPPGAVVIQVVPYGKIEGMARLEFGEPARGMGLRYLDYVVTAEESTLLEMLGPDHPAIKDPESVHRNWDNMMDTYLIKQSVRLNVSRFAPTLAQAFDYLRQQ